MKSRDLSFSFCISKMGGSGLISRLRLHCVAIPGTLQISPLEIGVKTWKFFKCAVLQEIKDNN